MVKKYLRLSAFMLAVCLVLTMAACGKASGKTDNSTTTSSSSTQETQKDIALEDYTNEVAWEFWILWNLTPPNPSQTELAKYIKNRFKIDITTKAQYLPADEVQLRDKLNLALASNQLPDVFALPTGLKSSIIDKAADAGMLMDVSELMDKNMSDFKNKFIFPEAVSLYSNPSDKKLYTIPVGTFPKNANELGLSTNLIYCYGAREDIFAKLKLEYPKTPDELYAALKIIKKEMPKVNGQTFYPMLSTYGVTGWNEILGATFGLNKYNVAADDANKTMITKYGTPEYSAYLKFMAKLYRENLIPRDFASIKPEDAKLRIRDGRVGYYIAHQGEFDLDQGLIKQKSADAILTPVPMIKAPGVEQTKLNYNDSLGIILLSINKKAAEIDRLTKFLAWQVSEEGYRTMYYGPPDKEKGCWYVDENKKAIPIKGKVGQGEDWTKIPNELGGCTLTSLLVLKYNPQYMFDDLNGVQAITDLVAKQTEMYKDEVDFDPLLSVYQKIPYSQTELDYNGSVSKVFEEEQVKIIMTAKSDEDVDSMIAAMLDKANKAGLETLNKDIYSNRYLKAKALLEQK